MATPPQMRVVRADTLAGAEDMPSWALAAFTAINQTLAEICNALAGRLTRGDNFLGGEKVGLLFTSPGSGVATQKVKHGMDSTPKHFTVTKLELTSGSALTAAYSVTWAPVSDGLLEVSFQGLPASSEYRFNCTYE